MKSYWKGFSCPSELPLFLFITLTPFLLKAQDPERIPSFPGAPRDDGVCFRIDDHAYCGTGLKVGWTASKDFHAYDLERGEWEGTSPLPKGEERQYASAFSHQGRGYVVGGVRNGAYQKDLWSYDPVQGSWVQMSSMPGEGRSGMASFCIDGTAYIVGGKTADQNALQEVWAYDMEADEWEEKGGLPFGGRWQASGVAVNGRGYLFFGEDRQGEKRASVHAYDPQADEWDKISSFPKGGCSYVKAERVHGRIILLGGEWTDGSFSNEIWSFDPHQKKWEELRELPVGGRRGGMSFSTCSTLYYCTGLDTNKTRSRSGWSFTGSGASLPGKSVDGIELRPNPAKERFLKLGGD